MAAPKVPICGLSTSVFFLITSHLYSNTDFLLKAALWHERPSSIRVSKLLLLLLTRPRDFMRLLIANSLLLLQFLPLTFMPSQASIYATEIAKLIWELRAFIHALSSQGQIFPFYTSASRPTLLLAFTPGFYHPMSSSKFRTARKNIWFFSFETFNF